MPTHAQHAVHYCRSPLSCQPRPRPNKGQSVKKCHLIDRTAKEGEKMPTAAGCKLSRRAATSSSGPGSAKSSCPSPHVPSARLQMQQIHARLQKRHLQPSCCNWDSDTFLLQLQPQPRPTAAPSHKEQGHTPRKFTEQLERNVRGATVVSNGNPREVTRLEAESKSGAYFSVEPIR